MQSVLLVVHCWRVHTQHRTVRVRFHKWTVCTEHVLPFCSGDWRWNSTTFVQNLEKCLCISNSVLLWIYLILGFFLAFTDGEVFFSLLHSYFLWHICQWCEPEQTRQVLSFSSRVSETCSLLFQHTGTTKAQGDEISGVPFCVQAGPAERQEPSGNAFHICCICTRAGYVTGYCTRRWHSRPSNTCPEIRWASTSTSEECQRSMLS